MGAAIFVGQVNFVNQLLLPRGLYPEINVPSDVTVYDAIPKTLAEMVTISIDRRNQYAYTTESNYNGFSFPAGYTRSDLSVRFADFDRQWQCTNGQWRYLGGRIELNLSLAVYADRRAESKPRCWAMILEHELLHARDEIEIVKNYLPNTLNNSPISADFCSSRLRRRILIERFAEQAPERDRNLNNEFSELSGCPNPRGEPRSCTCKDRAMATLSGIASTRPSTFIARKGRFPPFFMEGLEQIVRSCQCRLRTQFRRSLSLYCCR